MDAALPVGTLALVALLTLLPFALLATTSFAKISIVLLALRNALGLSGAPSGMVVTLLAALLTLLVMTPTLDAVVAAAAEPAARIDTDRLTSPKSLQALRETYDKASSPLRAFLDRHTHDAERALMLRLANQRRPDGAPSLARDDLRVLLPAFLLSELAEAFQVAFLLLLPFVVIDVAVASVMAALGMQALSPMGVALPLKLLLFVLVDGFARISEALVQGYG